MLRVIESDLVDIMLTSVSGAEYLTGLDALGSSPITRAIRVNDSSDIWNHKGPTKTGPAAPFRTARLDRVASLCDLGLYSDQLLQRSRHRICTPWSVRPDCRERAATAGIRHFLEVFNPLYPVDTPGADFADYKTTTAITRCLAGVLAPTGRSSSRSSTTAHGPPRHWRRSTPAT